MRRGKKIACLTGGLGNQLFQFGAARDIFGDYDFTIEWKLGITNLNDDLVPEIFDYALPPNVLVGEYSKPSKFSSRLTHLILRKSSSNKRIPFRFLFFFIEKVLSLSLVTYLGGYFKIIYPADLSSTSVRSKKQRNEFLIGFFHSNDFISSFENRHNFNILKPKSFHPYLLELTELSLAEEPIVVHMRLGDYEKETDFGILSTAYYEESLDLLFEQLKTKHIWVFSNDLSKAKSLFPDKYMEKVRWIPDFSKSSVQVLEAMRLGHAFVLSNSTFSWWAASISHKNLALKVVPRPWFKSANTNAALIPSEWLSVSAWN